MRIIHQSVMDLKEMIMKRGRLVSNIRKAVNLELVKYFNKRMITKILDSNWAHLCPTVNKNILSNATSRS